MNFMNRPSYSYILTKWRVFQYNYSWPDYVWLLDGWIARSAMAIPVVGYLILFNDSVSEHLKFENLAAENTSPSGLSSGARLKFIYLGLLFLGCANISYRLVRPTVMRLGINQYDYVEAGLKHFTFSSYLNMHDAIRHSGFGPHTIHGDYYDIEWDGFKAAALGPEAGASGDRVEAHWVGAKSKYEGLLRSILIETYIRNVIKRRGLLSICIFLALVGYVFLTVPSADLFVKVMKVILEPLVV